MSKTYIPYDPDQQLLLPAALQEWLPPDHLAYFISDVADQLDLSAITARYEGERRGGPPYHPRMMVKVLLYGYCVGVASSRRIAQRLHEDIAFRVLAANNTPDFRTVSDFRKDHLEALGNLFLQVLALCQQAGLVKLGHVALDGTKVRANASRHKAMSYGRMKEKEARLQAEVDELLRKAQEVDEEEDRRYGKDRRGDELPEELAFREGRLRKIREAKEALEAEALAKAEQAESEGRNHPWVPDDKAQRNFTDPDSRIMPGPGGRDFQQSYNCQAVVDSEHQVIVAARSTDQPSDKGQAVPMIEETILNAGAVPKEVSADAGYYSAKEVEELYALGVDPFVAPEKTRHGLGAATGAPGPHTEGTVRQGPDAPQAADETGQGTLRPSDGDGGTGVRPDQAGPGIPAVPAAGSGEGEPGVAADLRRPQPAEAVPLRGPCCWQGEGQRRHREQQDHVPGHGQWDFQATIRLCLTAPRTNCCRRAIPADRHRQLVNSQTGC